MGDVYQVGLKFTEGMYIRCKVNIASDLVGGSAKSNLVEEFKYNWVCTYTKC